MILALVAAARAIEPARAWESLYDARLVEAADGTPEVAVLYYEELVAELSPEDPLYGTAWYWLGRTRDALGNADGAVAALRTALRDASIRPQAAALLGRIELRDRAVRALPASFAFDDGTGAFVRAWEAGEKGGLGPRRALGGSVLAWETTVRTGEADHIAAALETGDRLHTIAFQLRSTAFPAEVRVTVGDGAGGRYSAPVIQVPTDQWLAVELPLTAFRSTDGTRGEDADALRPRGPVRMLEVEDLTGILTPQRGANVLLLDTVELR